MKNILSKILFLIVIIGLCYYVITDENKIENNEEYIEKVLGNYDLRYEQFKSFNYYRDVYILKMSI